MYRLTLLCLIMAVVIVSCRQPNQEASTQPPTVPSPATQSQTPIATINRSATPLASQSPIATNRPPMITATMVPARIPTLTPWPTLVADEQRARLIALFRDNADCQLPCWWGIVPGQTSWPAAHTLLSPLASFMFTTQSGNEAVSEVYVVLPQEISSAGQVRHFYQLEGNVVQRIELRDIWDIDTLQLAAVLTEFGKPDEVRLQGVTQSPEGPLFSIAVVYPGTGIYIEYGVLRAKIVGDQVQLCAPLFSPFDALLMSPETASTFEQMIAWVVYKPEGNFRSLLRMWLAE